jgi:restriction system protein
MISYEDIPTIENIPEPKISFIDKLFGDSKRMITEYNNKVDHVNNLRRQIEARNKEINEANSTFSQSLLNLSELLESKLNNARLKKEEFENLINAYESGNLVEDFIKSVIENSDINNLYNLNFDAHELTSKNHFACDISLPNDLQISKIKNYKEYKRDGRIEPIFYNDRDFKKIYDSAIYSIFFRIIREIYTSDYCSNIQYLNINGWVNVINKKNGQYENRCIMSLAISKENFLEIDFENVDLKAAFKNLKGITTTSLLDFIPVAPLISINRSDKRFIQSNEVLKNINEGINLAAISWEDFEHLVRELFEREFSDNGGEVKVTQSSRDGGVDAVAFDPDPIRGGKIVIQSKRYTNVVGVSAIRDLYGTVLNEGATKGIIITTSHYGSDAYEFAKGKPLTLLDGNNLLFLLEKHGYKARIDINEIKNMEKN